MNDDSPPKPNRLKLLFEVIWPIGSVLLGVVGLLMIHDTATLGRWRYEYATPATRWLEQQLGFNGTLVFYGIVSIVFVVFGLFSARRGIIRFIRREPEPPSYTKFY